MIRLLQQVTRRAGTPVTLALAAVSLSAQTPPASIEGTWEADVGGSVYVVVIRADSSASFGDQTVRYRLAGDSLRVALGGQWFTYAIAYGEGVITIAGGDLVEPITLRYAGPPTPRPDSIPVPPPPDGPGP